MDDIYWFDTNNYSGNYGQISCHRPRTMLQSLAEATSTWNRVPLLNNYSYDSTLGGTISYTACANFRISNWGFAEVDGSGAGCYIIDDGYTHCD